MRGIRIVILVAFAALVLSPLTAAAQVPSSPAAKASIEKELSQTPAAPQEVKPETQSAAPAPAVKPAKKVPEKRTETIVPAFSGIKERTAVFVFYVWLWLSIVVLIYFLRLWVKESDRVYHAKYYEPDESPRKANPMPPTLGD